MLRGLAPYTHDLGSSIQSFLHGVEHRLVPPAPDAPVVAGRTLSLHCATRTRGSPVDIEFHAVLDRRKAPDRQLPGRAAVLVVPRDVDEVPLAEATRS